MEVIVDKWNDANNEVEEVVLQLKKGIQRFSDTTIEGGGLIEETIEESIILHPSNSPILEDYASLNIVTNNEIGRVDIIKENDEEREEIYMDRVIEMAPTHAFYCPNCYSCIRKVYIQLGEWEQALTETIRCPSCFTFVIPFLAPIPYGVPALVEKVTNDNALEILKSIVYGGLTQSLASLTVVTSASSADATILSIVALALANLFGGLFIFVHNLLELKGEEPKREENQTEEHVDRYKELLGQGKNFYVHAFIAIISFIVFGLVPPLVYGFSFHDNGDKVFKNLGAVVCVSLLCITLLSIAKAYTKKSNTFVAYFKTMIYYVCNGVVGSVLSYLVGYIVKKLLEKVPRFELSSNFGLHAYSRNEYAKN
ncbi:hypothetical protein Lal_00008275 [Lupinus albus]|uniref:Uncharacterized protein n=1 Tax=Lupinus albus TaxID=3870 RepID=A0A6A5M7G3_LUPAL|nr:hypothetical protein Lalb_Chr12g0209911 [Lupinus albus]KAF1868468.1 hypothetical protein Lal_00008275 [Lupinus albus]